MKNLIHCLIAALASGSAVFAGDAFSLGGTNGTLSSVVVPAQPFAKVRVQLVSGVSDKATSKFKFQRSTASAGVTGTVLTNQTVVPGPTNATFSASDVVVLYSLGANRGARAVVSSANATAITLTANATVPLASGDTVFKMGQVGSLACGNATTTISGATLFHATGSPVLVDLDGTADCQLLLVSGEYF
jgi:hypothetical protein